MKAEGRDEQFPFPSVAKPRRDANGGQALAINRVPQSAQKTLRSRRTAA
jgi:hypothetical protein